MEVTKVNANTIRVTKTMPVAVDFTLDYLLTQKANITAQRDRELAEVDELIAECTKLNVIKEEVVKTEE